jgi:hypothetical protein
MVYNTQNYGVLDFVHRPVFDKEPSVQFCSTDGSSCRHKMVSQHSAINPCMLHHNFYCTFFLLSLFDKARSQAFI